MPDASSKTLESPDASSKTLESIVGNPEIGSNIRQIEGYEGLSAGATVRQFNADFNKAKGIFSRDVPAISKLPDDKDLSLRIVALTAMSPVAASATVYSAGVSAVLFCFNALFRGITGKNQDNSIFNKMLDFSAGATKFAAKYVGREQVAELTKQVYQLSRDDHFLTMHEAENTTTHRAENIPSTSPQGTSAQKLIVNNQLLGTGMA